MRGFSLKLLIILIGYLEWLSMVVALGQDQSQYEANLVEPLVHFGTDLLRRTMKETENIILSPASIQVALNLVLLGAKGESDTERELVKTLGYSSPNQCNQIHQSYAKLIDQFKQITERARKRGANKPSPVVDIWTRIISKEDLSLLKPEYLNSVSQHYHSSVVSLTKNNLTSVSSVAKEINNWAKEAGFGSELINGHDLVQDFSLLLLSAIRLETRWLNQLVAQQAGEIFHDYGQSLRKANGTVLIGYDITGRYVEFSQELGENSSPARELANLEFQAISLPLMGDISFDCFVPLRSGPKMLAELESELLTGDTMMKALKGLDESKAITVFKKLQMPKFDFETDVDLVEPLRSLGLASIFDQSRAELDEMSSSVASQFLSDAKHRALIEVTEIGLKAAAITMIQAETLSDEPPSSSLELTIDKPFVFVVRLGRLPLFMGHLVHLA